MFKRKLLAILLTSIYAVILLQVTALIQWLSSSTSSFPSLLSASGDQPSWTYRSIQLTQWLLEQERRKALLEDECRKNNAWLERLPSMEDLNFAFLDNSFVSHRYQIVYCAVPKSASSSWKSALVLLNNKTRNTVQSLKKLSIHEESLLRNAGLIKLSELKAPEVRRALREYTKFLMVRHPLTRLLSAYVDKFTHFNNYTMYFHKKFGTKIAKLYRKKPTAESLRFGHDVTFSEFLRFVVDVSATKYNLNSHWMTYERLCQPCVVRYDYILKYETLRDDVDVMLALRFNYNADPSLIFPWRNSQTSVFSKADSAYRNVTEDVMKKVVEKFRNDFTVFGYQLL